MAPHIHDVYHPDLRQHLFPEEFGTHPDGSIKNRRLPHGETEDEFFTNFVNYNFNRFAKFYGCEMIVSAARARDARILWKNDLRRTLEQTDGSDHLDQFKRAGFLAYWIRRRMVTEEIFPPADGARSDLIDRFVSYGNEICSFNLGYHFCLRFAVSATRNPSELMRGEEERETDTDAIHIDIDTIHDVAVYLKHKSVSPHALYLIFKMIFRNT